MFFAKEVSHLRLDRAETEPANVVPFQHNGSASLIRLSDLSFRSTEQLQSTLVETSEKESLQLDFEDRKNLSREEHLMLSQLAQECDIRGINMQSINLNDEMEDMLCICGIKEWFETASDLVAVGNSNLAYAS